VEHIGGFSSGRPLIIIKSITSGAYLACGYLSIETAEAFGEVCAIVGGVDTAVDFLHKTVGKLTSAAKSAGIKEGMTGREALLVIKSLKAAGKSKL
jgi:uncharacterized protein YunC (DUF1805 family)